MVHLVYGMVYYILLSARSVRAENITEFKLKILFSMMHIRNDIPHALRGSPIGLECDEAWILAHLTLPNRATLSPITHQPVGRLASQHWQEQDFIPDRRAHS